MSALTFLAEFTRADWMRDAARRGMETELFYPGQGETGAEAKAVCRRCPVRDECLSYGLREPFGVFGALTERERRILRRRLPVAPRPSPSSSPNASAARCAASSWT